MISALRQGLVVLLILMVCAVLIQCTDEVVPRVTDTGIYINEIAAKGEDWMELYNSTDASVNLSGYKVHDGAAAKYTLPSLTLPAKGFLILYCDSTAAGSSTNFRLSSGGETVYLEDANGALIDQVDFPALTGSQSYARFPDGGEWAITGVQSQFASNGTAASATIRNATRTPLVPGVDQSVTVTAEVTDPSGLSAVKLFYRLDNGAWQSVNMTAPGSVYSGTIPAAGSSGTMYYYIEALNNVQVKSYQPASAPATPYFYLLNTDPLPQLFINEYLAWNNSCCADTDGGIAEYDDWIEIYNAGNTPVDISNYYLSDSLANPFKFRVATGNSAKTTILAGGFLVITADEQGGQGVLHASFRLNQAGEQIGLYYIDGRLIDQRTFGAQSANQSEGRSPNGSATWKKLTPTKGTSNP